jgi:drug/metabolite transporter (DMT)-like permease
MHLAIFILICCIWGTSFILMKWSLQSYGPISVGAIRVMLGAAALGLVWLLGRRRWPLRKADLAALTVVSLIAYCVPFCLQPFVLAKVQDVAGHGSTFIGLIICLVPLCTALVSVPMLKIYPTRRQVVGICGGLAFMLLLYIDELKHDVPLGYLLLGAISPLCYATGNAYLKRRFQGVPPLVLALAAMGLAGLMMTPLSMATETVRFNETFRHASGSLAILGVICTGLATYLFYMLIQHRGPLYAGMITYIVPCVAMLAGWLDKENVTLSQVVAILGMLAMVGLVQYKAPIHFYDAQQPEAP